MRVSTTTKILVAVLLLVAAVAAWYLLYIQGQGNPATAQPPPPKPVPAKEAKAATSPSARALEILPLPFLVTEAPKEVPAPGQPKPAAQAPAALPEAEAEAPPNPFLPLPQKRRAILAAKQPPKPKAKPVGNAEKPVAIAGAAGAPELLKVPIPPVRPPTRREPVVPPEARLGGGTLPLTLAPVAHEVAPQPPTSKPVSSSKSKNPKGTLSQKAQHEKPLASGRPKQSELKSWLTSQHLELIGVTLGPVPVAIFKTKGRYLTLAIGDTFPNSDVRVKYIGTDHVLLEQGQKTLLFGKTKGGE